MSERFDLVEYRAARTMGEVDFFFRHQTRIIAARRDMAPRGIMARIRRVLDAITLKDGLK